MNLRRIRHFTVLAETLNFSRAAERLHIAQPALSVSIQKLETELGTKLFDRTPSGVTMTAAGQAALVEARRLVYHGEQLQRTTRDAAQGTGGQLRIGFVGSAIYRWIPTLISAFRTRYPGVELVLREVTSSAIARMLAEEALDIGIVRTPLLQAAGLELHTLQRDGFVAAVPSSHPLAATGRITLAQLAGDPFVMYTTSDASGLHGAAMAACQAAGFLPQVAQQASQIATVLALVESGLGVALVPEVTRERAGAGVACLDLTDLPEATETTLALAWVPGHESPAAQRFVELAREISPPGSPSA
ncbi:MAG TPA: LysR family transcriptional regulator [Ramlibacter sp.]|nr:LysR family transcriptional regulator [Ramlibacter sp.]